MPTSFLLQFQVNLSLIVLAFLKKCTSFGSLIVLAVIVLVFVSVLVNINSTFDKQEFKNLELSVVGRVEATNCVVGFARRII